MKSTTSSPSTPNTANPGYHREVEAAAAAWLARQDHAATWHAEDDAALQAWLQSHTAHRVAWLRLRQAWLRADRLHQLPVENSLQDADTDGDASLGRAPGLSLDWPPDSPLELAPAPASAPAPAPVPVPVAVPARRRTMWMVTGLSLAVVAAAGVQLGFRSASIPAAEHRYATALGGRQDITLADGSQVTLNTRTSVRAAVTSTERQFWLEQGEAFFAIRPDPQHPFVIVAGNDRITVLGTKFSVRYEGGHTRVTVLEGRVRLDQVGRSSKPLPTSVTLARNQSAVSQAGGIAVAAMTPEQAQSTLGWRQGLIAFDNQPLADIAAEFNRYSARQLVVDGPAADLKLSGSLTIDNVDAFVRLIDTGFGVTAREHDGKIHLSMK